MSANSDIDGGTDAETDYKYVRAFQDFIGELFRLSTLFLNVSEKYSQDIHVTMSEWRVIASMQFGDSRTVPQIARYVGISRQAVRQTVQKLESKGFVRLDVNPDHRRSSLVALTPEGHELMIVLSNKQTFLTHLYTDGMELDIGSIEELTLQLGRLRKNVERLGENSR